MLRPCTCECALLLSGSSDVAGQVTINHGTSAWVTGLQITITFNKIYNSAPRVVLIATNAIAAVRNAFVTSNTATFTINYATAATGLSSSSFNYIVVEN